MLIRFFIWIVSMVVLLGWQTAHAQEKNIITVPRYDDADEFLPPAERRNNEGVRLVLAQQPGEETLTAISDRNVSIKIISMTPANVRGGVILFTGGNGVLSIDSGNRLDRSFSFLTRSRDNWWKNGLATFVVDAPSDKLDRNGMSAAFRATTDFRSDLIAVLSVIKKTFDRPLFAVGISNGATAVANIASIRDESVAMYVLISPATTNNPGSELVSRVAYSRPVLIVGSKRDECRYSPPSTFDTLRDRISAPSTDLIWIEDGKAPIGGPCGPFGQHSYFGAESAAIAAIASRLK